MSLVVSFMGRAIAPPSAHAKRQVKLRKQCQQWYARPASGLFADNPCNFNAIGAFTGRRRASESRTEEQACRWRAGAQMKQLTHSNQPQVTLRPLESFVTQKAVTRRFTLDRKARFAGGGRSARIRSLVWRHFEQEIQAQIKTEAGRTWH